MVEIRCPNSLQHWQQRNANRNIFGATELAEYQRERHKRLIEGSRLIVRQSAANFFNAAPLIKIFPPCDFLGITLAIGDPVHARRTDADVGVYPRSENL